MAHEVETMFYVGATPWHGLGKELKDAPSTEQAIIEAGLDWTVHTEPLYRLQNLVPTGVEAQCVVRDTDQKVLCHHVGPDWTAVQNKDAFNWYDPWVKSGQVRLVTAGSLRGGQVIWVLAEICRDPLVIGADDVVKKYVLLTFGHGNFSIRAGFTPIRVVCMNTLRASVEGAESQLLKLKHTAHVVENLEKVREIIDLADQQFKATEEQYRWLASRGIDELGLRRYVRTVLRSGPVVSTEEPKRNEARIIQLFETGRGSNLVTAKGTYWGAYNAVSEFLTWERGRTNDSRLDSLWMGQGKQLNKLALDTAIQLAA